MDSNCNGLSKDALLAAVLRFRDSLPEDHERRQQVAKVTDLRFDTCDPTICYLLETGKSDRPRRIDPTQSAEAIAESMILYKAHSSLNWSLPSVAVQGIKDFRHPLIRDLFVPDSQCHLDFTGGVRGENFDEAASVDIIVHTEVGTDTETIMILLYEEHLRQTDEIEYISFKLMHSLTRAIAESSQNFGFIITKLDSGFIRQVQELGSENSEGLQRLKQKVESLLNESRTMQQKEEPNAEKFLADTFYNMLSDLFPTIWPKRSKIGHQDATISASGDSDLPAEC